MTAKQRPPLTPAESSYLGLDTFGWHTIAWASQSRSGVTHHTQGKAGCGYSCTCPGWQHRQTCKHVLSFDAALAHHLGDGAPADPGGATLNRAQDALGDEIGDWRDESAPYPYPLPTLDEAVALAGDRWIQSRTSAGVRLTCTSCGAVRGWATEVGAIDWLATDGACGCGGTGPTPPAHGAAHKPLREHLDALYGSA